MREARVWEVTIALCLAACGGHDDGGGAAGTGGVGGAAGAGGSGAAGATTGAPAGSFDLQMTVGFDQCDDLPALDPAPGGTLALAAQGNSVTATFGGWPAEEMRRLIDVSVLEGTYEAPELTLDPTFGDSLVVSGCATRWYVGGLAQWDGTVLSGALVYSRGVEQSAACSEAGIDLCARSVSFLGTRR